MGVFSTNDLEDLEKELLRLAKKYPKEAKKFLQKQGNKLKAKAKKKAKSKIGTKTGNYLKGFKRGEHILEDSQREFQDEFLKAADGFIDEVIKNGGF